MQMQELVDLLNKYSYEYYVLDNPTVSDKDYDVLYDKLVKMEKQTGIILPDSPTQRVGDVVLDKFKKVNHKFKLYSLDKCQNFEELASWFENIKKAVKNPKFTLSYKFDGLSIAVTYKNGKLVSGATRGNGTVGEDVTAQVKTIKSLPLSIDYKGELIVRGEGMIKLSKLAEYNKTSNEPLKNARNAVAGAIRNLDSNITAKRNLDIFCYDILYIQDKDVVKSQVDTQKFLQKNGFLTSDFFCVCSTLEQIEQNIKKIDTLRTQIDILTDGVVIDLDDFAMREELGFTTKFPKWAVAYKFPASEVTSILQNVIWQVGRTGKVTPIAEVEPVELAGATVKRATLNNMDDIRKKNLKIGSRVFIRRSNEVIPEIMALAEELPNSKEIFAPTHCPCCNTPLVQKNVFIYCPNKYGCKDQIIDRITHFASRDAMNIEGLSEQTISLFYDNFDLRYTYQLYDLTAQQLESLPLFKNKKATNIFNSIQSSKKCNLSNFIFALGIGGVGIKTAKDLAKYYKTLQNFLNAGDELASIRDIGEITANQITSYIAENRQNQVLQKLIQKLDIAEYNQTNVQSKFTGKTVVLTGTLSVPRAEMTAKLESMGASVVSSVSKNTDFVLAGENPGSKYDKAKQLGIQIIGENDVN